MKGHPHSAPPSQKGLSLCCSISYCFLDPLAQLEHRKHLDSMHTHTMILTIFLFFLFIVLKNSFYSSSHSVPSSFKNNIYVSVT